MRRLLRWFLRLLLALIVLVMLLLGAGWWWFHPGFRMERGIVYTKRKGHELTLDVVKPEHPKGSAILVMVSGNWKSDPKKFQPWHAASFLREGLTMFAISHLSQPEATVQEIVEDVHRAARSLSSWAAASCMASVRSVSVVATTRCSCSSASSSR